MGMNASAWHEICYKVTDGKANTRGRSGNGVHVWADSPQHFARVNLECEPGDHKSRGPKTGRRSRFFTYSLQYGDRKTSKPKCQSRGRGPWGNKGPLRGFEKGLFFAEKKCNGEKVHQRQRRQGLIMASTKLFSSLKSFFFF